MDPDITIMFSIPCTHTVNETNTCVNVDFKFNRKPHVTQDAEIDSIWGNRLQQNSRLFNGSKFRLDSATTNKDQVVLNLGITCYKDFIGTNWSPRATELQLYGKEHYDNSQACMSDALGVGAFVQTTDDYVIFLRRSKHCAEAADMWDIPGGHPEPQELVGQIPVGEIDLHSLQPHSVVTEIYNSIAREIVDEVNIPESSLSKPQLMGIARNNTSAGRPSAEFMVRCSLNSPEILKLYNKGNQEEAYESTNIKLVAIQEIIQMAIDDSFWQNMAPSAKGCITLYRLYIDEESRS